MRNIYILYHSKDLDGYCSGAIASMYFRKKLKEDGYIRDWLVEFAPDNPHNAVLNYRKISFLVSSKARIHLIGVDYGQEPPEIEFDSEVVLMDMSYSELFMRRMINMASKFTWIDHHKSSIEKLDVLTKEQNEKFRYVLDRHYSACELAWYHFFPDKHITPAVTLLGKYDTWRGYGTDEWNNNVMPFQMGMRQITGNAYEFPVILLEDNWGEEIPKIMMSGEQILKYQEAQYQRACAIAFEDKLCDYRALCMNIGGANFTAFKSVWDGKKHDIAVTFHYTGTNWKYSLFTDKPEIDVSEIAKRFGGGGHKGAAGFTSEREIMINKRMEELRWAD